MGINKNDKLKALQGSCLNRAAYVTGLLLCFCQVALCNLFTEADGHGLIYCF